MAEEVWVSSVMGNYALTDKPGIREKWYGQDWAPPTHILPPSTDEQLHNFRQHRYGFKLPRTAFPEAMYAFSPSHWRRVKDWFAPAGFYAVKGKLAQLLMGFNLGDTEMIEFSIYGPDKQTRLPGPFYLLNFGVHKTAFLPDQSRGVKLFLTGGVIGRDVWKSSIGVVDDDIAISTAALMGPDLWIDPHFYRQIFMSGSLHDAIVAADLDIDFRFSRARIVGLH